MKERGFGLLKSGQESFKVFNLVGVQLGNAIARIKMGTSDYDLKGLCHDWREMQENHGNPEQKQIKDKEEQIKQRLLAVHPGSTWIDGSKQ